MNLAKERTFPNYKTVYIRKMQPERNNNNYGAYSTLSIIAGCHQA